MKCRTCHHELSQCLDGRLPSGQRTLVMAHVAECAECGRFWAELQAAQELVRRLPRLHVGRDFREQLFERIETGEGTPPAVFQEPVPALSKIRYALTGAAAAAAVLVAATWLRNRPSGPPTIAPAPTNDAVAQIADAGPIPEPSAARTEHAAATWNQGSGEFANPIAANPLFAAVRPLTSDLVAVEAAKQFQKRFTWTTRNVARLEQANGDVAFVVREVCDNAADLRELAKLLLDLREDDHVTFSDPRVDVELRFLVQRLEADADRLREHSLDTVRTVVAPTLSSGRRLGQIADLLLVQPARDPEGQQQSLWRLSVGRPSVFGQLFVVLPELPPFDDFDLRDPAFRFRDACGVNLVAPRSEVEEKQQFLRLQIRQFGDGHVQIQMQRREAIPAPPARAPTALPPAGVGAGKAAASSGSR